VPFYKFFVSSTNEIL